jgi:hypothetical protein
VCRHVVLPSTGMRRPDRAMIRRQTADAHRRRARAASARTIFRLGKSRRRPAPPTRPAIEGTFGAAGRGSPLGRAERKMRRTTGRCPADPGRAVDCRPPRSGVQRSYDGRETRRPHSSNRACGAGGAMRDPSNAGRPLDLDHR